MNGKIHQCCSCRMSINQLIDSMVFIWTRTSLLTPLILFYTKGYSLSFGTNLDPTCTGGFDCGLSPLLESIATLLRLDELNRLFLEPPPIVLMLLLPKLWLLLRLAFMLMDAAPPPGFLSLEIIQLYLVLLRKHQQETFICYDLHGGLLPHFAPIHGCSVNSSS